MDPIISYIRDGIVSIDKKWTRKMKCQVARYMLIDGVPY